MGSANERCEPLRVLYGVAGVVMLFFSVWALRGGDVGASLAAAVFSLVLLGLTVGRE